MPSVGHDSSTRRSFGPGEYAPIDDACTSAPAPAATAASNTRRVPVTFVRASAASSRDGWISQARWMTASAPSNSGSSGSAATSAATWRVFGGDSSGPPARDRDDLPDALVALQRGDHAGADVAGRAGDDDPHGTGLPAPGWGRNTVDFEIRRHEHGNPHHDHRRHPLRRQVGRARGAARAAQEGVLDGDRDGDELHRQLGQPGRRPRPGDHRVARAGHRGGARAREAVRRPHQGALRRRPRLARTSRPSRPTCSRPSTRPTSSTSSRA